MEFIKGLIVKLVGKKFIDNGIAKLGVSKAKVAAIVSAILVGANAGWQAYNGAPVDWYATAQHILEALGLWAVRDAIK